ncbi:zinc finger, CCHC-type containing protein [Tanacetum coccineum]
MSGDKNENTNIVYREVAASLSSYQCPVLNNTNYTLWALRMKKILLANGVWDLVEGISTSKEIDVKKDSSASAYLFQGLPEDLQMQVAGCETAKEIWDSLKSRFLGTEDVQQAHSQQFKSEFERLVMKEDESIDSFARKLMSIITKAATCGLTFDEQTKVRKVLNAVPDKFVPVVATIEMIVDFKTVKLEEIIGKLKTYEERIKFRKGSQEDNSEKLLFTRQGNDRNYERNYGNDRRGGGNQARGRGRGRFARDSKNEDSYDRRRRNPGDQNYHRRDIREIECYNCHEFGHYFEKPKPERRKEISNLVYEDNEPTLLMVTSLEEEPTWNENGIERDEIPKEKLEGIRSEIEIDLKSKLELWKLGILQEIEMEKQEFEKKIRNREMAFEKQMQRELENLKKLRDYTSKKMKKLKTEREQFEKGEHIEKTLNQATESDPEDHDYNTKRNRLLEIQDYEMKQMKEDSDKGNKNARDEVEDKEERSQIKEEVQDIVRVKDKNKGSGNKHFGVDQKLLLGRWHFQSPLCFFGSLEGRWKRGLFVFLLFSRWSSTSIFATSFVMPGVGRGVASIAGVVSMLEGTAMVVTIVCATSSMMPLGGVPAENGCPVNCSPAFVKNVNCALAVPSVTAALKLYLFVLVIIVVNVFML